MPADELCEVVKRDNVDELGNYLKNDDNKKYINTSANDGMSAIHCAAQIRNTVMLALLLAAGANPNRESEAVGPYLGYTAAHYAAGNGDVEMLQLLYDWKANFNRPASDHWYPLHLSVFKNKHNATVFLVDHGADVNSKNNKGQTALVFAVSHGRVEDVRFLIKSKANLTYVDANNDTLMHHALHYQLSKLFDNTYDVPEGQLDVAVILAIHGCPVNEKNIYGEVATHFMKEKMPTLPEVLTELAQYSPLFISGGKEWNYLSLVSLTIEYLQSIGFTQESAEQLCSDISKLENERQLMKEKRRKVSEEQVIANDAKMQMPANHPQISLTSYTPGNDPSGGKCPFFQQQRNVTMGKEANAITHLDNNVNNGQKEYNKHKFDDGQSLCPFSFAFIYRHRNTLLLIGLAFVSGMWADQVITNLVKSNVS